MSRLLTMRSRDRRSRAARSRAAADASVTQTLRMWHYLPLAILATASVVVLPVVLVAAVVPRGGEASMATSVIATVAASIAISGVEAALWTRLCRGRDLTFSELMLWGWLRRCWAERGLAERRELHESARKIGPSVSVDQLERLSRMLEARDSYTHGHSRRVARHAARIARRMHLPEEEVAKIRTAAAVHDVGKIYTPREILNNPGRLTDAEFEVVKRHAADGAEMLATVGDPEIAAMVRHHHERIDGKGYPDGLSGDQIPLGARIIAVADTFDALTSSRSYRGASTHRRALGILSREAGSQLDRDAVSAFLGRYSSRRSIASLSFVAVAPERILAALQSTSTSIGAGASGAASFLPALGVSGLLALSPAIGHLVQTGSGSAGHRRAVIAAGAGSEVASSSTSGDSQTAAQGERQSASPRHGKRGQGESRTRLPQAPSTAAPEAAGGTEAGAEAGAEAGGEAGAGANVNVGSQPGGKSSGHSPASGSQPGSGSSPQPEPEEAPSSPPAEAPAPSQGAPPVQATVAGVTETVTGTTKAALSGTTGTLSQTTKSLSGLTRTASSTTTALLGGGASTTPQGPQGSEATP